MPTIGPRFRTLLVLSLFGGACGGSSSTSPSASTPTPLVAPSFRHEVVPGFTSGAADLYASSVAGADAYVFEVGTASGLSDIATLNSTGPTIRVADLPPKRVFFARARAKRGAEAGPVSAEITIPTFDLKDAIDAAYFSNGPLVARTQTPCSARPGVNCQEIQWREFAGTTVTLQLSSDLDPAARSLLVVEAGRLSGAGGRFRLSTSDAGTVAAWGTAVQANNTIVVLNRSSQHFGQRPPQVSSILTSLEGGRSATGPRRSDGPCCAD